MPKAELILDAHALVGEGPVWLPDTGELLWVDIESSEVHRLDAETAGWVASLNATGGDVSAYGLTRDGRTCFLGSHPWPK